jgi:transposase
MFRVYIWPGERSSACLVDRLEDTKILRAAEARLKYMERERERERKREREQESKREREKERSKEGRRERK